MGETKPRVRFILPTRIAQPISWHTKPGWFGLRFFALFTDGKYRRVSVQQIRDNAHD